MGTTNMANLAMELVQSMRPDWQHDNNSLTVARRRSLAILASDSNGLPRREWQDVRQKLQGLARTARIRVDDEVADAYEDIIGKLARHSRRGGNVWDEELPLQTANIPQYVQLLLELSQPTSEATVAFATEYFERPVPPQPRSDMEIYQEIMAEPFAGDHWGEGYDEEVKEGWTDSDESGSDLESDTSNDVELLTPSSRSAAPPRLATQRAEPERRKRTEEEQRLLSAKLRLQDVSRHAYWKTGGREVVIQGSNHGWKAMSSASPLTSPGVGLESPLAISPSQLQRELLFVLSGRPGIMFSFDGTSTCSIRENHPNVSTYSPTALNGVLNKFASRASQIERLRHFVKDTLAPFTSSPPHRHQNQSSRTGRSSTLEAFAEACRVHLHECYAWVAELESALMGVRSAPSKVLPSSTAASTPLLLDLEFSRRYGDTFDYLCSFIEVSDSANGLLNAIHVAICDPATGTEIRPTLVNLFIKSASPMWRLLGDWLVDGMPVPTSLTTLGTDVDLRDQNDENDEPELNPEFFIQRDKDSYWSDEDFWEAGFVAEEDNWPAWLEGTQDMLLETGKGRGLLRGLALDEDDKVHWPRLDTVINIHTSDISAAMSDFLTPICEQTAARLNHFLQDCALQQHLSAIDGVTLMRGTLVLQDWVEWLMNEASKSKRWADIHHLTHSLRDSIESHEAAWMNAPAVRARTTRRPGRATLSDVRVDYLVPFPLSQLFTSTSLDLRASVFTFLLRLIQARKQLLEARRATDSRTVAPQSAESRRFRSLKHALAWVLDTVWAWINDVIDIRTIRHHDMLAGEASFSSKIRMELDHVRQLQRFCFLHVEASSTLESIEGLLDLASDIHLIATWTPPGVIVSPTGEQSRNRRRHQRRTSDSEASDGSNGSNIATSTRSAVNQDGSGTTTQLAPSQDDISNRLNSCVKAIRQGVDELADRGGPEQADVRELWRMLAFALEDWKETL